MYLDAAEDPTLTMADYAGEPTLTEGTHLPAPWVARKRYLFPESK